MPIVSMPDGQKVRFPDDMSQDRIRGLIASKYPREVGAAVAAKPREERSFERHSAFEDRPNRRERRGDLAPIIRDLDTGEISWAVPNVILGLIDAVKLPGEVARGEVDPMSDEGFDRTMGLATAVTGVGGIRGTATRPRPPSLTAGERNRKEFGLPGTPVRVPVAAREFTPTPNAPKAAGGGVTSGVSSPAASVAEPSLNEALAGNIRLDRIYGPEDVKAAIRTAARENEGFMDARRGVQTQDTTRELAQLTGMTPKRLARRKTGEALNAEEMFAARSLLVEQATKVRDAAKLAEGGSELQKLGFKTELTRLQAIQEQVSGATAEAGRALQQFRMIAGASKDQISAMMNVAREGGLDDVIAGINKLDDPAQVAQFAANAAKATTSDMVMEAWINSLLSGPQTHAVNTLSNALVSVWGIAEAGVAAGISKATGSGIPLREAGARAFGFLEGAKDGLRAAARSFRTEEPLFDASKIDTARQLKSIPGIVGRTIRIPGRALTAEDSFFKTIAYRQEINALAARQATSEGLKGRALASRISELRANPTEEMQTGAHKFALQQTFTNPLGPTGQSVQGILRRHPTLRVALPFFRTPVNLIKYAAERTPAALLMKDARANLMGRNGAVARDQQIAKVAMGTAVGGAAVYEALQGNITGGGPTDAAERALLYADGWQPYSIRVGDTYYAYGRLEPLGQLLGIAADMAELGKQGTEKELEDLGWLIVGSVSKNLTSKTWLRGPSELMEAISDPDRYGERYLQRLSGTIVPTGIAQLARTQDPYLREARTVLDTIRDRIPGQREQLLLRRDVFGEPIRLEGGVGPDIASPIYTATARRDPTIAEMQRLEVFPGRLQRKIKGVELEDGEFDFYSQAAGRTIKQGLDALVASPHWEKLPDDLRADAMGDVVRKSRDIARTATQMKFPDLILRIAREKEGEK